MDDIALTKNSTGVKDFLRALTQPLQTSLNSMATYAATTNKRVRYNGQKIVLQAALNEIFGVTSAPYILIETNNEISEPLVFFNEIELQPVYFSNESENAPVYFFNESEASQVSDFTVKIPVSIYTTELERQITAEVNLFKLAGKTFNVITYA